MGGNHSVKTDVAGLITAVKDVLQLPGVIEVEAKQSHRLPREPHHDADGKTLVLHDAVTTEIRATKQGTIPKT